jgi:hypothetical protein
VLTNWCVAALYSSSGSLSLGSTNTGGVESTFFSCENAVSASFVHSNFLSDFFDYGVICDIVVFCCFCDDNTCLVYVVGDIAVSGGEVRCCIFAEILAKILVTR